MCSSDKLQFAKRRRVRSREACLWLASLDYGLLYIILMWGYNLIWSSLPGLLYYDFAFTKQVELPPHKLIKKYPRRIFPFHPITLITSVVRKLNDTYDRKDRYRLPTSQGSLIFGRQPEPRSLPSSRSSP